MKKKEDLMNKKVVGKYERFGKKNSSLFNTIILGFLSIDATSEGKKKEKKKETGCHQSYECIYTHTHTKKKLLNFFEERKKKKKIVSVVVVVVVGEMKFGWLVVCYKSQRSKSGIQHG